MSDSKITYCTKCNSFEKIKIRNPNNFHESFVSSVCDLVNINNLNVIHSQRDEIIELQQRNLRLCQDNFLLLSSNRGATLEKIYNGIGTAFKIVGYGLFLVGSAYLGGKIGRWFRAIN